MSNDQTKLWDSPTTASFLNLPERTLGQWAYQGIGPRFFKVGRYRRYHPDDVRAWLEQHASTPKDAA